MLLADMRGGAFGSKLGSFVGSAARGDVGGCIEGGTIVDRSEVLGGRML